MLVCNSRPGSVVVKYRIGWVFKDGIHNAKDPIDVDGLKTKLTNILARNSAYISNYHVVPDSITSEKILDKCLMNQFECEQSCIFDYKLMDFTCACKEGMQLAHDGKTCVEEEHHVHIYGEDANAVPVPEPAPQPEPEPQPEPQPETEVPPQPEPQPEPVTEHEASPEPEPEPVTEHEASPEPQPEPVTEHEASPEPEPEPEPVTEHEASPEPQPEPKPEPVTEHETPQPEPVATTPKPEPQPSPEPEPDTELHYHTILQPEEQFHPQTEVSPEIKTEQPGYVSEHSVISMLEPTTPENSEEEPSSSEPLAPNLLEVEPLTEKVIDQTTAHIQTTHENMVALEEPVSSSSESLEEEPSTEQNSSEREGKLDDSAFVGVLQNEKLTELPVTTILPEASNASSEASATEIPSQDQAGTTAIPIEAETMPMKPQANFSEASSVVASPTTTEHTAQANTESDLNIATVKNEEHWIPVVADANLGMVDVIVSSTEGGENEIPHHTELPKNTTEEDSSAANKTTTELITATPTPKASTTHEHVISETENANVLENMSPFLPETENNDTLIHILHSDVNHYPDHVIIHNETGNEEPVATNAPPRLDNDEMNTTNPADPTPKDTIPGVLPLDEDSTEKSNEIPNGPIVATTPISKTEAASSNATENVTTSNEIARQQEEVVPATTSEKAKEVPIDAVTTELAPDATTLAPVEETTVIASNSEDSVEANKENLTLVETTTPKKAEVNTLIPEAVEATTILPSLKEETEQVNTTASNATESEALANLQDFSSSTEDLIALETTTKSLSKLVNNTSPQEIAVLAEEKPPTTVHAEIIETATHTVQVVAANEVETTPSISNNIETVVLDQEKVNATGSTTIKSLVEAENDVSATQTPSSVNATQAEVSTEGLSVIPLPEHETNDTKQEIKRVVDENDYNRLDGNDVLVHLVSTTTTENFVKADKENFFTDSYLLSNNEQKPVYDKYEKKAHKKEYYDKKGKYDKLAAEEQKVVTEALTTTPSSAVEAMTMMENEMIAQFGGSKCLTGQFQCVNGTSVKDGSYCISGDDRCDSVSDCSDGSDEEGCQESSCFDNFQVSLELSWAWGGKLSNGCGF